MNKRTIASTIAGAVLVAGLAGGAVAVAQSDEGDTSVTGPGADKAVAAALAELPGGHANAVERDSENGATWEVEVKKADGSQVDVRLDADYKLVVIEPDGEAG